MSMISSEYTRTIAASEATYGTDAVNTVLTTNTADIIYQEIAEPAIQPQVSIVEINRARGTAAGNAHGVIKNLCSVTGRVPMLGRAADVTTPYYAPYLKAMNLKETVDGTVATYHPKTVQQAALTQYLYHVNLEDANSRLVYATGVRGTGTFELALDAEAAFSFEGVGQYNKLSAPAAFFNATTGAAALLKDGSTSVTTRTTGDEFYANLEPMLCTGMTLTVDSVAFPIASMNLSLNWEVNEQRVITGSEALQKVLLTRANQGARIGGDMLLLDGATAFAKVLALYESGSEVALSAIIQNSTTKCTLTATKLQLGQYGPSAQGGIMGWSLPFFLNGNWAELEDNYEFELKYEVVA